jgi:hypothetical protein
VTELAVKCRDLLRSMSVQLGQYMCFDLCNPKLAGRLDIDPISYAARSRLGSDPAAVLKRECAMNRKGVGPALRSRRVLASLPVSELSNDLFTKCGRKRLLARDHAGLPNRLANLVDVGIAAGAVGEVALEPLLLVGRQRVVEVVGDDLDHLLAAELVVHGASLVK